MSQNMESSQGCSNVKHFSDVVAHGKYLFKSFTDTNTPFGYEKSDLKNLYLSRKQLESKMTAPFVTQEELLRQRAGK
jgi:hypothetical protein